MTDQDELNLHTLTDLEHEVRRRHGGNAAALLTGLPLDYERRLATLRRLAGREPAEK